MPLRPSQAGRIAGAMLAAASESLLDLLYPPACWACGSPIPRQADGLCADCPLVPLGEACGRCAEPQGPHAGGPDCPLCRGRSLSFRHVAAAGRYEAGLKDAVRRAKFGGESGAWDWMGSLLSGAVTAQAWAGGIREVVPVPSSRSSRWKRGFNPAELLAGPVARRLGVPVRGRLRRRGAFVPQVGLGREARLSNVRNAFEAVPGTKTEGAVLLVDDVMTTGATVDACAAALLSAGAASVDVAVLAR